MYKDCHVFLKNTAFLIKFRCCCALFLLSFIMLCDGCSIFNTLAFLGATDTKCQTSPNWLTYLYVSFAENIVNNHDVN